MQTLEATFTRRRTHAIPQTLPAPPASWHAPFAALAQQCGFDITTSDEAYERLSAYWSTLPLALTEQHDQAI